MSMYAWTRPFPSLPPPATVLRWSASLALSELSNRRSCAASARRDTLASLWRAAEPPPPTRSHSLAHDLGGLLESERAADVVVVAGSAAVPPVPCERSAHRAVLAARCDVLAGHLRFDEARATLSGDDRGSRSSGGGHTLFYYLQADASAADLSSTR